MTLAIRARLHEGLDDVRVAHEQLELELAGQGVPVGAAGGVVEVEVVHGGVVEVVVA